MKSFLLLLFSTLLLSRSAISQQKLSARQQKLDAYVEKFRNDIKKAPTKKAKAEVLFKMYEKHIVFLQDTLKFTIYPEHTFDGFYFNKAIVKRRDENNRKYIDVTLINRNYRALAIYDITSNANPMEIPLYKALLGLKPDAPVLAVINISNFSISDTNIDKGSEYFILAIDLKAIINTK